MDLLFKKSSPVGRLVHGNRSKFLTIGTLSIIPRCKKSPQGWAARTRVQAWRTSEQRLVLPMDWLAVAGKLPLELTVCPLKIGLPKRGVFIFQPSSFKGSVSFTEGNRQQRTLETEHFPTWSLFLLTRRFWFMAQFGHQNGWMIFVFPYSALTFGQNFLNFFLRRNQGWEVFFQIRDRFTWNIFSQKNVATDIWGIGTAQKSGDFVSRARNITQKLFFSDDLWCWICWIS